MADLSIPLAGMARAQAALEGSAGRIARAPLSVDPPRSVEDTVDLSAEMVALLQAKNNFELNVKVAQAFDEINQTLTGSAGVPG